MVLGLTTAEPYFTSIDSWVDHICRVFLIMSSIPGSKPFLSVSTPKWVKDKLLIYLWMTPTALVLDSPSWLKSLENVSKYHISTNFPSCWRMRWLSSGSVDTTTGRPKMLVRKMGPNLKLEIPGRKRLNKQIPQANLQNAINIKDKYKGITATYYLWILFLMNGWRSRE